MSALSLQRNPEAQAGPGPIAGERQRPGRQTHSVDPSLKVAYVINQYPMTSHSFIRREIASLEAMGYSVQRYAIRAGSEALVDPMDRAEQPKTQVVLGAGLARVAWAVLTTVLVRPKTFFGAVRLALRVGRQSERGTLVHLVYLAEACLLLHWLQRDSVAHVHAHFGTNSTTVAMLCEALGGPAYSFTVHGPEEFDSPRALALGEKIARAVFVVAISEYGRSQLYRWAAFRDWPKIHVVHCGLDALFFDCPFTPPPPQRRLVSVGRLVPQKGQMVLVEAAARLAAAGREFELILVGDGPLRSEIEAAIARHGLEGRVKLAGWQSNAAVRDLLLGSRAIVLPSFAEGLPVVLMEALALGRPAITTGVAGIPELVRPGENGWLVPPGSVEALVDAMTEAFDAIDEEIATMGRAGAARVRRNHDAATEAHRLALLFSGRSSRQQRPA